MHVLGPARCSPTSGCGPGARTALALSLKGQSLSFYLPTASAWGAAIDATGRVWTGLARVAQWRQDTVLLQPAADAPTKAQLTAWSVAEALDYHPSLSTWQELTLVGAAAGACGAALWAWPGDLLGGAVVQGAALALLAAALLALGKDVLLESQFQALQRSGRALAYENSCFLNVEGIDVHYTVCRPLHAPHPLWGPSGAGAAAGGQHAAPSPPLAGGAVHCVHGLGSNTYSWSFVQGQLADALGAVTTAHDMAGFGLTQRRPEPEFYSMRFNTAAMRAVMDAEHQAPGGGGGGARAQARVLVGHSMGGAAVAEAVIANPTGVSAIVLVAPAIVTLWPGPSEEALQRGGLTTALAVVEEALGARDPPHGLSLESFEEGSLDWKDLEGPAGRAARAALLAQAARRGAPSAPARRERRALARLLRAATAVGQAASAVALRALLRAADPLLVVMLRRLVRSRSFWSKSLAALWVNESRVDAEYVDGYRQAQLVRGWERGLLNFVAARLEEKPGLWEALGHAVRGSHPKGQADRLAEVVQEHGIPVLILHGADDLLVPPANSRRLARLLPGARLVEFGGCGHMPQEEAPQRFVQEVVGFLASSEVNEARGPRLEMASGRDRQG